MVVEIKNYVHKGVIYNFYIRARIVVNYFFFFYYFTYFNYMYLTTIGQKYRCITLICRYSIFVFINVNINLFLGHRSRVKFFARSLTVNFPPLSDS